MGWVQYVVDDCLWQPPPSPEVRLRIKTLSAVHLFHTYQYFSRNSGSSGFCVLPFALGALPPAPRHLSLWASSMNPDEPTVETHGCLGPRCFGCSGFLSRLHRFSVRRRAHYHAAGARRKTLHTVTRPALRSVPAFLLSLITCLLYNTPSKTPPDQFATNELGPRGGLDEWGEVQELESPIVKCVGLSPVSVRRVSPVPKP